VYEVERQNKLLQEEKLKLQAEREQLRDEVHRYMNLYENLQVAFDERGLKQQSLLTTDKMEVN